jgi:hypothetical protein
MGRHILEAKYTGRGLVQETFVQGSNAIARAMFSLTTEENKRIFDNGKLWYSAEIIYTKNPNVVHYTNNAIVFHERPVLRLDNEQVIREFYESYLIDSSVPFAPLMTRVDQDMLETIGWHFYKPQHVNLKSLEELNWLHELIIAAQDLGPDDVTLRDALRIRAKSQLMTLGVCGRTLDEAVERLVEAPGCPSLTTLKTKLPTKATVMLRNSSEWASHELNRLDISITRFASAVLKHVRSHLVTDHAVETARINKKLNHCIELIKKSKNQNAISILNKHNQRLEEVTPVEGIVFTWGDKLYKLTGSFASVNAIIGLCKYGRGKAVPPLEPI